MTAVIYTVLLISENYTTTKYQTCSGNSELFIEDRIESRDDISNYCSTKNNSQEEQTCKLKHSFSPEHLNIDLECECYLIKFGKHRQDCDTLKNIIFYYIVGALGAVLVFCLCRVGPNFLSRERSSSTNNNRNIDTRSSLAAADNMDQLRLNELHSSPRNQNADRIAPVAIQISDDDVRIGSVSLNKQPLSTTIDRQLNLPTYENVVESPPSYEVATICTSSW